MSLECAVCSYSFPKLKRLACSHAFCSVCLEKIELNGRIRCPYCRQVTCLRGLGIDDLASRFGGHLDCTNCGNPVDMTDGFWCQTCRSTVCSTCSEGEQHSHHLVEKLEKLGPVKFSILQLDRFAYLHTTLTMIQKKLIREYIRQLKTALEQQLETDLNDRLMRLKLEKQHLKEVFELEKDCYPSGTLVPSASSSQNGQSSQNRQAQASSRWPSDDDVCSPAGSRTDPSSDREDRQFAQAMFDAYRLSPVPLKSAAMFEEMANSGIVFNPPPVDKAVDLFLEYGKCSSFAISLKALNKKRVLQVPHCYIGAGCLDDPCDLCVNTRRQTAYVICVHKGILPFNLRTAELQNLRSNVSTLSARKNVTDQFASITFDPVKRCVICTVLRDYRRWLVQVYDSRYLILLSEIDCPQEPVVKNGWNRWIVVLPDSHLLVSCGDRLVGVLWLLDLNGKQWTLLHEQPGAAYRKAAFHQSMLNPEEGLLYVPEMQSHTLTTFVLNTTTWSLSKRGEIRTAELSREMPICVDTLDGCLMVGNWTTGNVIAADLFRSYSRLFTCVGPKQLCGFCFVDTSQLLVLCKQKEVLESYLLTS